MAVGMFKLTLQQRKLLYGIFIALNVLQIILGASITGSSLYVIIAISPTLYTDKAEISFVFVVTGIYGTHIIFHWIIGIKIAFKSLKQADKKSTRGLLFLWVCAGTNTVINLLIVSHFSRKINKHIIKSVRQSITMGMKNYLSDLKWKEAIDNLQYTGECCGMHSFTDWHENKWLTQYHVDVKSETVKQFRIGEESLLLPVTPWSCCKVDFPMQCLHDPLQQVHYAHIWVDEPSMVTNSINNKGCLEGLKKPVTTMINVFVVVSSVVFVLHIVISCVARILYTSSRNAILLGYPKGIAPGWIFGRGDCGYRGGKTLLEVMGDTPVIVIEHKKTKTSRWKRKKGKGHGDTTDGETTKSGTDKTGDLTETDENNIPGYKLLPVEVSKHTKEGKLSNYRKDTDDTGGQQSMEEELKRLQQ